MQEKEQYQVRKEQTPAYGQQDANTETDAWAFTQMQMTPIAALNRHGL
jgi:hypothetical protein